MTRRDRAYMCAARFLARGITPSFTNEPSASGPPEHDQTIPPVSDQPLRVPGSERAAAAEKENRFEQRGFPRAITTPDQVMAGMEVQLGVLDAAEVVDRQLD